MKIEEKKEEVKRTPEVNAPTTNMKLAFVEVRYKNKIVLPEDYLAKLPKKVILFTNIQYHEQYTQIKEQIEKKGVDVISVRPKHAWNEGQILGCSVEDWSEKGAEGFAYIGDGFFHPKAILFENPQPVFMYDPESDKQYTLQQDDIKAILGKKKGALVTFYSKKNVGVLITTKYGQSRLKESYELEKLYPDKNFYYLLGDVIDFSTLEDFPFIDVFVNTACPRIMDDHEKVPRPMLNIQDINNKEW